MSYAIKWAYIEGAMGPKISARKRALFHNPTNVNFLDPPLSPNASALFFTVEDDKLPDIKLIAPPYIGHVLQECDRILPRLTLLKSYPDVTRQFLGLASHYRRFISGFACIAHPLNKERPLLRVEPRLQDGLRMLKAPILSYLEFRCQQTWP